MVIYVHFTILAVKTYFLVFFQDYITFRLVLRNTFFKGFFYSKYKPNGFFFTNYFFTFIV